MNYNYAICIPRQQQEPYFWPMSLKHIDELFTTLSKEEILSLLKKNDSVITEEDAQNLKIMKRVSEHKYITERYTYIVANQNYLNYDINPFLTQDEKLAHILHNILTPFQNRNVSPLLKRIIPLLKENVNSFCLGFQGLPYEEKRIIWTALSEEEKVAKQLDEANNIIEILEVPPMKLERKAS